MPTALIWHGSGISETYIGNCYFVRTTFLILVLLAGCSPKIQPPDPDSLKPSWLKSTPYRAGYYTGIGHSVKDGSNNYIQSAKKSALEDLVSQIKVNVSSTSVLKQFEVDRKLTERYEQIIQTTAVDEIEDFELVDAWEDGVNYWVYYQLSMSRYRQIKEEQKQNATILATDYFQKAKAAEDKQQWMLSMSYYFQAFRSIEKYLGEAIRVTVYNKEVLLINEIYASLQGILSKINLRVDPAGITLNRRVNQNGQTVSAIVTYGDVRQPVVDLPLVAKFEKGAGDIFPSYTTDRTGRAIILMTKIDSKELEQTVRVSVDVEAISGTGNSPILQLIANTLNVPGDQVILRVQRPIVFLTSEERSLGRKKTNDQISNKLRNLLAKNGFEFTHDKGKADLWFDVKADSEEGSVSGSIYVTYLTSVIKVFAVRQGIEIYATTLDRVKGYGLDYDKSSIDAYDRAMESLEKDRMNELLSSVLQ